MKTSSFGIVAATALVAAMVANGPAAANKTLPTNLGPDQWVRCAGNLNGGMWPVYAWWNPGWPAPHNTRAYAEGICNQWHGGVNSVQTPPIAGQYVTSPKQVRPQINFTRDTVKAAGPRVTSPSAIPTVTPSCGPTIPGDQASNTC